MKKVVLTAMMIAMSVGMNAQTVQRQVVEEGGTGPFKSEVVGDASCTGFTVYRPQNLKEVVAKQGALPVIVYANGACFNNNVEMRLLLSEVASYGYVAAAIGPYDEADVMAQWRGVLKSAYPETKGDVIMANGEKILPMTAEEKKVWLAKNTNVCLGSDAFFPFGDNIERAKRSGVQYIAQPGGSIRDDHVIATCNKYNMTMAFTGIRLFHH